MLVLSGNITLPSTCSRAVSLACFLTVATLGISFVGIVDHGTYHCLVAYEVDNKRLSDGRTEGVSPSGKHLQLFAVGNRFGKEAAALETSVRQDIGSGSTKLIGFAVRQRYKVKTRSNKVRKEIPAVNTAATRFFTTWRGARALLRTWCGKLKAVGPNARTNTLFFPKEEAYAASHAPDSLSQYVEDEAKWQAAATTAYPPAAADGGSGDACLRGGGGGSGSSGSAGGGSGTSAAGIASAGGSGSSGSADGGGSGSADGGGSGSADGGGSGSADGGGSGSGSSGGSGSGGSGRRDARATTAASSASAGGRSIGGAAVEDPNSPAESKQDADFAAASDDERARLRRVMAVGNKLHTKLAALVASGEDDGGELSGDGTVSESHSDVGEGDVGEGDVSEGDGEVGDVEEGDGEVDDVEEGDDGVAESLGESVEPVAPPVWAGAGAGAVGKDRAEAAVATYVRFLSAGQRCWDWFVGRRGHVTASVATRFLSLASQIAKATPGSVALRRLTDSTPERLVDAWHGSFRGNQYTEAGNRNEAVIATHVKQDLFVNTLFEAGLAESKSHRWLATSPDGIGAIDMNELVRHLQGRFADVVEPLRSLGNSVHVPFEYKTFAAANRRKYEDLADAHGTTHQWMACSMDSEMFATMVPNVAYRRQLIHSVATFRLPAAVFVASTEREGNPIISKVLVVPSATVVKRHVDALQVVAEELMDWVHAGPDARAPDWMRVEVAQLLESHQRLWWATRLVVLKNGPMHPIETMRVALVVIYNK